MWVHNVRCKKYPPGIVDIPDTEAKELLKKGDVQDLARGALHLDTPEFEYQTKVVKAAKPKAKPAAKPAPKKPAKKKVAKKKAK